MSDDVVLPIVDVSGRSFADLTMMDDEEKIRLVDAVIRSAGLDPAAVPAPWATRALRKWVWLVLTVNGEPFSEAEPKPLIEYGIDPSGGSEQVRMFIWAIA